VSNKDTKNISELDELKLIYFEILEGRTYDPEKALFIKHFSDKESHLILKKRVELFHYYSKEGVPHEADLLKTAIENEEWSKEKEEKILELKYHISDNEKNIHNIIPEQRDFILKIIEEKKNELSEMIFERKQVLGRNIEDLIDEDVNDFAVYLSFFKDESLKTPIEETYSKFQEWDLKEINLLKIALNNFYLKFREEKIKAVCCLPIFLNKLSYCKEDISIFLKKPIAYLTFNQSNILSLGLRNINILSNSKGSPPDLSLDAKIEDLVKWYDIQNSINIAKKNSQD